MIYFHSEDLDFSIPSPDDVITWIIDIVHIENRILGDLNIIFCSDAFLLKINQDYLNHDYLTDIITFDNSDNHLIEGDLFISIDRIAENASNFNVTFIDELHRVIIHGILHLLSYNDDSLNEQATMRNLENYYLTLRRF